MKLNTIRVVGALAGTAALFVGVSGAMAQKSKDTIRLAVNDPFVNAVTYCVPAVEVGNFSRRIFLGLIAYDEHKAKYVPMLAKSWKRINPTTLELELRDDVKFHNGNKFDADDVIGTFKFLQDPKVRIRYKTRYAWVKEIQKLSPYKIRIVATQPTSTDLGQLAYRDQILDAETLALYKNPCDYGSKTPVGTGPLKVVALGRNVGIHTERYDGYNVSPEYVSAPIKRVYGVPIPDREAQVAQLLVNGIDIIQNVPADNARNLATQPHIDVETKPTGTFVYIVFDAKGRTDNKALMDERVRRAIFMALDRDKIIKAIVPGGDTGASYRMDGFCFKYMVGCSYTVKPAGYDPEGAKKLLAEAGYPNGVDITYDVFNPIATIGKAIAGELLKVGIRAHITLDTIGRFYKRWVGGETEMLSVNYPAFSFPDAGNTLDTFFGGPRDYTGEPIIQDVMKKAETEMDPKKRAVILQRAFNVINQKSLAMAFSSLSTVFAHSDEVTVKTDPLAAGAYYITDYHWK